MMRMGAVLLIVFGAFSSCQGQKNDMVLVEGGKFEMTLPGSEKKEVISIAPFYISPYEVTSQSYGAFSKDTNIEWIEDGYWGLRTKLAPTESHPAIYVSWFNAVAYCNWLSTKDGLKPAYIINGKSVEWDKFADGYRLLSAAEWEWAARGGQKTQGFQYSGSNDPFEVAVFNNPIGQGLEPVGTKKPNELGIYDMTGNAEEWCWDIFPPMPDDPQTMQERRMQGDQFRVLRGGDYTTATEYLPKVWESSGAISDSSADYGFRIARNDKK